MNLATTLAECIKLQTNMNELVNPDWKTAEYDWELAAVMELTEFIDHLGWKWWKKQDIAVEQAFVELVDVLHFALSMYIRDNRNVDTEEVNKDLIDFCEDEIPLTEKEQAIALVKFMIREFTENRKFSDLLFAMLLADLHQLAEFLGYTREDLYRTYIGKNVLNIFRQDNGYKTGEYIKMWGEREDNEVMSQLIIDNPTVDKLYERLSDEYKKVKNA